ncbi:MAG: hypothetical protein L0Z71_06685 [Anaerolineae bacterium]|nr:hypothetical protein [Anaerolineae bacterium]
MTTRIFRDPFDDAQGRLRPVPVIFIASSLFIQESLHRLSFFMPHMFPSPLALSGGSVATEVEAGRGVGGEV